MTLTCWRVSALLQTGKLVGVSFLLFSVLAIILGIVAALCKDSVLDRAINLFSFAGISVPVFFLALMLIFLFAVRMHGCFLAVSDLNRESPAIFPAVPGLVFLGFAAIAELVFEGGRRLDSTQIFGLNPFPIAGAQLAGGISDWQRRARGVRRHKHAWTHHRLEAVWLRAEPAHTAFRWRRY